MELDVVAQSTGDVSSVCSSVVLGAVETAINGGLNAAPERLEERDDPQRSDRHRDATARGERRKDRLK